VQTGGTRPLRRDCNTDEEAVVDAEAESAWACELCGSPGPLRTRNSWLPTLCGDCARSQEYEDLPRGEDG
jgi:hypothetical protein